MEATRQEEPVERVSALSRTCAGCGAHGDPEEMLRLVMGPDRTLGVDPGGRHGGGTLFGRGARLHPKPECVKNAAKSGLARSFRTKVSATPGDLAGLLGAALE